MASDTQRADYAVTQKIVHWLMAILIMMDLFIAQKFGGVMADLDRFESRNDHTSIGTIVTVLFIMRIYLRWKHGTPPLPAEMPEWQKLLAHAAHWALYGLIATLIIFGILAAMNANTVIAPFGLFAFGDGTGAQALYDQFRWVHELATELIIATIALHVVAALYHLVIVRDGLTERMLTVWKSQKNA
ncbi:MAG: cytochrome b [Candidatus Phaeomarinobacter sp.]